MALFFARTPPSDRHPETVLRRSRSSEPAHRRRRATTLVVREPISPETSSPSHCRHRSSWLLTMASRTRAISSHAQRPPHASSPSAPRPIALGSLTKPEALLSSFEDGATRPRRRLPCSSRARPPRQPLQTVALAARAIRAPAPVLRHRVLSAAPARSPRARRPSSSHRCKRRHGSTSWRAGNRDRRRRATSSRLSESTRGRFTTIYSTASFQAALDHLPTVVDRIMIEYLAGQARACRAPPTSILACEFQERGW